MKLSSSVKLQALQVKGHTILHNFTFFVIYIPFL